jgi:hypothetical protein
MLIFVSTLLVRFISLNRYDIVLFRRRVSVLPSFTLVTVHVLTFIPSLYTISIALLLCNDFICVCSSSCVFSRRVYSLLYCFSTLFSCSFYLSVTLFAVHVLTFLAVISLVGRTKTPVIER